MPQTQTNAIKMVISQPTTFEQSDEICAFLKRKKISNCKFRICK